METLTLDDFTRHADAYDTAVARTPGVMRFCTASPWLITAHQELYPRRETLVLRDGEYWQVWSVGRLFQFRTVIQPLEADWFFGCPVVGPKPGVTARILLDFLIGMKKRFPLAWIGGVPVKDQLYGLILSNFRHDFKIYSIPGCDCHVASLEGGLDGYLGRRSSRFRQMLRKVEEQADANGVETERWRGKGDVPRFMKRLLSIEQRSWKGDAGESIFGEERFRRFYARLIGKLGQTGDFRALFLKRDGKDIAYIMGGVFAGEYRGFQMSYDRDFRELSPGHLCQSRMIRWLTEEGLQRYDLGMAMDYKQRWSDGLHEIANVLLMAK